MLIDGLKYKKSINKLVSYDIDKVICYHGGIY